MAPVTASKVPWHAGLDGEVFWATEKLLAPFRLMPPSSTTFPLVMVTLSLPPSLSPPALPQSIHQLPDSVPGAPLAHECRVVHRCQVPCSGAVPDAEPMPPEKAVPVIVSMYGGT